MKTQHGIAAAGLVLCIVLGLAVSATQTLAGEAGTLKLKVSSCPGSSWLSGATVDVVHYRAGVGVIDKYAGTTDASGYVEIAMEGLEEDDEARVTITPSGMSPDDGHIFYWIPSQYRAIGYWDLGPTGDSLCQDGWYDQSNNTILAQYS